MKYLTIIVVFLVVVMLMLAGMMFKIMHWPYANFMILAGITITLIAVIVLLSKKQWQ